MNTDFGTRVPTADELHAHIATLREELESMTRHAEECQSMYHIDGQACIDAALEALAATPEQSLARFKAEAGADALERLKDKLLRSLDGTESYGFSSGVRESVRELDKEVKRLREAAK